MTIYDETITNEYLNASRAYANFTNDLKMLPRGTIQKKHINKSDYLYLCYRDGKKVKTEYLNEDGLGMLTILLQRRKYITEELISIKKKRDALELLTREDMVKRENNKKDKVNSILDFRQIVEKLNPIFKEANIKQAILFGSYAKGYEKESSDIDIMVETNLKGLEFFELSEKIRTTLGKEIDLITKNMIKKNSKLENEIEKTGVIIFNE